MPLAAQDLASAVVRSALMAMVVIDVVWGRDLHRLQEQEMGLEAFPRALGFWTLRPDPKAPTAAPGGAAPLVLRAVRARDRQGRVLGTVVESTFVHHKQRLRLRWVLGPDGREIRKVRAEGGWPDSTLRSAFVGLEDRRIDRGHSATGPAERAAVELITAVDKLRDPGERR